MLNLPGGLDASVGRDKLLAAVRSVLTRTVSSVPAGSAGKDGIGGLPSPDQLRAGAVESLKDDATDYGAAEYFQSVLELAYLVASADGLADGERDALAALVEHATDAAVNQEQLRLHFQDLDAAAEALGRRERMGRVAANFGDSARRHEALAFAALVAIADGTFDPAEKTALVELGQHFAMAIEQVQAVVDDVSASLKDALDG
jgi:tellurite resistance protein